jgi:hypothetical protein
MSETFISAGWTTTGDYKTDEEAVKQFIDGLGMHDILNHLDELDPQGRYENEVETGDDLEILDTEENRRYAAGIQADLKVGLDVLGDLDENVWVIPGTDLFFHVMGGASYGDNPFEGYDELVMFLNSLDLWDGLRELTDVVCGGLPGATVVAQHIIPSV